MECQFVKSIACLVPTKASTEADAYQLMATPNDSGVKLYVEDGNQVRSYQYNYCITPELVEETIEKEQNIIDIVLRGYVSTVLMTGKGDTNIFQQRKKDVLLLLDLLMKRIAEKEQELQEKQRLQQPSDTKNEDAKSPLLRIEYAYVGITDNKLIDIRKDQEYPYEELSKHKSIDFLQREIKNMDSVKTKARFEVDVTTFLSITVTNRIDGMQGRLQIVDLVNPPFNELPATDKMDKSIYYSFKAFCDVVDAVSEPFEGRINTDNIILTKLLTPTLCGDEQLTILAYYNTRVSREAIGDLTACFKMIEKLCQIAIRMLPTVNIQSTVEYKKLKRKIALLMKEYEKVMDKQLRKEEVLKYREAQVKFLHASYDELAMTTEPKQAILKLKADLVYAETVIDMRNSDIEHLKGIMETQRSQIDHLAKERLPELNEKVANLIQQNRELSAQIKQYEVTQGSQRNKDSQQSQEMERLRLENIKLQKFNERQYEDLQKLKDRLKEAEERHQKGYSELDANYQQVQQELSTAREQLLTAQRELRQKQLALESTDTEASNNASEAAIKEKYKKKYQAKLEKLIQHMNDLKEEHERDKEKIKTYIKEKEAKLLKQFEEDIELVREAERAKLGGDATTKTYMDNMLMRKKYREFEKENLTLKAKVKEYETRLGIKPGNSRAPDEASRQSSVDSTSDADSNTVTVPTKDEKHLNPPSTIQPNQTPLIKSRSKRTIRPDTDDEEDDDNDDNDDEEEIQTAKPITRKRFKGQEVNTSGTTTLKSQPSTKTSKENERGSELATNTANEDGQEDAATETAEDGKTEEDSTAANRRRASTRGQRGRRGRGRPPGKRKKYS